MHVETIESPTGAALNARFADVADPAAVVAIQHGMAEHSGRYERFQAALAARGYASVAHDHRGHGHTKADEASVGRFAEKDGWDLVVRDAMAVRDAASERHPAAPVVVFGHSMGGLVAFNLALAHPATFAAAAIWNIGFDTGAKTAALSALLKLERFRRGSDVPSPLVRKLSFDAWNARFAPNRTAFDWLSRDPDEVDAYVADPHAGHEVTIGMWLDVLEGTRRAADDARLGALPKSMPVHLLGGARDPVTDGGGATKRIGDRLRQAGLTDVTVTVLENTRHEALNEVNRDTTTNAFIDWLDRRFMG